MSEPVELIKRAGLPAAIPLVPPRGAAVSAKRRFAHANAAGDGRRQEAVA